MSGAETQAAIAFAIFMAMFFGVGIASIRRSRGTVEDYYLASRDVSPAFAGLSAVATNNSGYMFIGVIGYTYVAGLSSVWLMTGWIVGDLIASSLVHRQLRAATERTGELTYAGVLARWHGTKWGAYQRLAGLFTVLFLGAYAAAQLAAGSKALHVQFGWSPTLGASFVALLVAGYSIAGGIRASIWTDVAQAFVMLVAMAVLLIAAVDGLGGPASAIERLHAFPGFMDWFPRDLWVPGAAGLVLFVVGWLFAGLSVAGQPHIMVRFMSLDAPDRLWVARAWYYGFFTVFYVLATGVGMLSRVYLPQLADLDPELALPTMAQQLLSPAMVGLLLAGIFAATMSTADSLVLACSSAITRDLACVTDASPRFVKFVTLGVVAAALALAIIGPSSVFDLVVLAWSTLAAAFVPLLIVVARGGRPQQWLAIVMLVVGTGTALLWRALGLHDDIYEGMPGILAGLLVFMLVQRLEGHARRTDARAGEHTQIPMSRRL